MYVYKIQSPIGGAFGVEGQRRQEREEMSASLVSKDKIIALIWNPVTYHITPVQTITICSNGPKVLRYI